MKTRNVRLRAALVTLPLLLLCVSCAPKLPSSTAAPIPTRQETPDLPPALAKPPQPESYLERAQERIKSWHRRLTDSETR